MRMEDIGTLRRAKNTRLLKNVLTVIMSGILTPLLVLSQSIVITMGIGTNGWSCLH